MLIWFVGDFHVVVPFPFSVSVIGTGSWCPCFYVLLMVSVLFMLTTFVLGIVHIFRAYRVVCCFCPLCRCAWCVVLLSARPWCFYFILMVVDIVYRDSFCGLSH